MDVRFEAIINKIVQDTITERTQVSVNIGSFEFDVSAAYINETENLSISFNGRDTFFDI